MLMTPLLGAAGTRTVPEGRPGNIKGRLAALPFGAGHGVGIPMQRCARGLKRHTPQHPESGASPAPPRAGAVAPSAWPTSVRSWESGQSKPAHEAHGGRTGVREEVGVLERACLAWVLEVPAVGTVGLACRRVNDGPDRVLSQIDVECTRGI